MTGIQQMTQNPGLYRTIHASHRYQKGPNLCKKLHGHAKQEHGVQTTPSSISDCYGQKEGYPLRPQKHHSLSDCQEPRVVSRLTPRPLVPYSHVKNELCSLVYIYKALCQLCIVLSQGHGSRCQDGSHAAAEASFDVELSHWSTLHSDWLILQC